MQNFEFLRIGEDGPQMVAKLSPQTNRVNDKVTGPCANLNETGEALVAAVLVGFQIDGNLGYLRRLQMLYQAL